MMKFHRIGIAKRLILSRKYEQAKSLLRSLDKNNNAEAQLLLGYLYIGGDTKTTAEDSHYWLKRSAKNGNAEAIALLALTDFKIGTRCNETRCKKYLSMMLKAATMGSAEAQRSLACAYAHGEIVPQDDIRTMYWDEKAAEKGLAESQNDLALMLLHGMGGVVDKEKAIYWYKQSAGKDHNVPYAQWAAEALERIYMGEPYKELANSIEAEYWKERAQYLSALESRDHPDWFYR